METGISIGPPMPRKFLKKYLPMPSHEAVRNSRHFARFAGFLHHPNLWHLNRHSVAGAVAVGMFSGLVPGPLQMIAAAILAVLLRVNLPVAMATTLYTNPFTIGPLYVLAYMIGRLIMGADGHALSPPRDVEWTQPGASLAAYVDWLLSMGTPLAVGLVALALALAALGYTFVQLGWRAYVIRAWHRRRQSRTDHGR